MFYRELRCIFGPKFKMLSLPRFEILPEKKLTGMYTRMSFAEKNKTGDLWRSFMPRRKEIIHQVSNLLYSAEVYDPGYFDRFDPEKPFEKWAAIEVGKPDAPAGMQNLIIPAGLYSVFTYKGFASEGYKAYQYIYGTWIPQSGYTIDDRPHFAVMGENYNNNDADSEEELWVPVKKM